MQKLNISWNDVIDLDKESLQKLQQDCDNLKPLFKIAHPKKQIVNSKSYFYIDDNLLMHFCKYKDPEADLDVIQIVVPKCLRKELLRVSHAIPMAAHLGINKMTDRLKTFSGGRQCLKIYIIIV